MICFGSIGVTTVTAVTDSPVDVYTAVDVTNAAGIKRYRLLVSSDVSIHLDRNNDADPSSSARIPAGTIVEVMVFGGDRLSAILAAGESDGSVWVTLAE